MATELRILSWCDVCLENGAQTPGTTATVDVTGVPAFDVEVCPEHGGPLADAVAALAAYGRPVDKGAPTTPTRTGKRTPTRTGKGAAGACPECPDGSRPYGGVGSLRAHLRLQHGKSLGDVGLEPANFTCPDCGSGFASGTGFSSHVRSHARAKESA